MKKILLCNCPNLSLYAKKQYLDPHIGAAYVIGGLKSAGFDVDYYDLNIALNNYREEQVDLSKNENNILSNLGKLYDFIENPHQESLLYNWTNYLISRIDNSRYSFIGLSIDRVLPDYKANLSIGALHFALILASFLHNYNAPVFIGGSLALGLDSFNYVKKICEDPRNFGVTGFFLGNGSIELPKFLNILKNKKISELSTPDIDSLNVVIRGASDNNYSGRAIKHSERARDLEVIPSFDIKNRGDVQRGYRALFDGALIDKYPEIGNIKPFFIASYKFSYGCANICAFCENGSNSNLSILPAKKVVDDLEAIMQNDQVSDFKFYNTNLIVSEKYIYDFCNEIRNRGLRIRFSDSACLKNITPDILAALKEAGCIKLWYGAETLSGALLAKINKNITPEEIYAALKISAESGIWNAVNIIINFPHESEDDFRQTKEFIAGNESIIDCVTCNQFMLIFASDYFRNPKKYNINISFDTKIFPARSYRYDEIGGLAWKDKKRLGGKRQAEIEKVWSYDHNVIYKSDYLLFALRQVFEDREKIKKILREYIEILDTRKNSTPMDQGNPFTEFDIYS